MTSPVGFRLSTVPKCFEGPAFDNFRIEERKKARENLQRKRREEERIRDIVEGGRAEAEAYENGKKLLEGLRYGRIIDEGAGNKRACAHDYFLLKSCEFKDLRISRWSGPKTSV